MSGRTQPMHMGDTESGPSNYSTLSKSRLPGKKSKAIISQNSEADSESVPCKDPTSARCKDTTPELNSCCISEQCKDLTCPMVDRSTGTMASSYSNRPTRLCVPSCRNRSYRDECDADVEFRRGCGNNTLGAVDANTHRSGNIRGRSPPYDDLNFTASDAIIVDEIEQKQSELSEKIHELHYKIKDRDNAIKKLTKSKRTLMCESDQNLKSLECKLRERDNAIMDLEANRSSLIGDCDEQLQGLQRNLDESEKRYECLRNTTNELVNYLNQKIDKLQLEVNISTNQVTCLENSKQCMVDRYESQARELMSHVNQLECTNRANSDQICSMRQAIETEKQSRCELEDEVRRVKCQVKEEEAAKEEAINRVRACEQSIRRMGYENEAKLQAQSDIDMETLMDKDNMIVCVQEQLESSKCELKNTKCNLVEASKQLELELACKDEMEQTLQQRDDDIEELKASVEAEEGKTRNVQSRVEEVEKQRKQLDCELRTVKQHKEEDIAKDRRDMADRVQHAERQHNDPESQRSKLEQDFMHARKMIEEAASVHEESEPTANTVSLFSMFNQLLSNVIDIAHSKTANIHEDNDKVEGGIHSLTHLVTNMASKNVRQRPETPGLKTHYETLMHHMKYDYEQRLKGLELKLCDAYKNKTHEKSQNHLVEHLEKEIEDTKKMFNEMTQNQLHLHHEQDRAHAQTLEMNTKMKVLETARSDALDKYKTSQCTIEVLQKQLEKTTNEITEQRKIHNNTTDSLTGMKFELEKERGFKQQLERKLCAQAQDHNAQCRELETKIVVVETNIDALKREKNAIEDRYRSEISKSSREYNDKISQLQNEKRELKFDVKFGRKELKRKERCKSRVISALEGELQNAMNSQQKLRQDNIVAIDDCKHKLSSLEHVKDDLCWKMQLGKMDRKLHAWAVPPLDNGEALRFIQQVLP